MLPPLRGYPLDPSVRGRPLPSQAERIRSLRKIPLFSGLSGRNLSRIDRIARIGYASAGRVLVVEGEQGDDLMVVLDGRTSVRRADVEIAECGPGQWFGEMSLLDGRPRSATVVAVEPTHVLAIGRSAFRKLLPKAPRLAETLLETLSVRLRDAQESATDPALI